MERLVIELSNIGLSFGKHQILEGANMSAKAGEIVGLMGPNGSGKSSLIKLLAGVYVPSSGIGIVCGKSLGGPKHPKVSVMFEYPPVIGELGAKEKYAAFGLPSRCECR